MELEGRKLSSLDLKTRCAEMKTSPTIPHSPRWYALRSQVKREVLAASILEKFDGVRSYCPRVRYRRRTRSGLQWITEALFPGYLFAQFDFVEAQRLIRSAQGVSGLVQVGGKCPPIPEDIIAELQEQIAANGEPLELNEPTMQCGQQVVITQGPLQGLQAVVKTVMPAQQRVAILLDFLGRELQTVVALDELVSMHDSNVVAQSLGHM